MGGPTPGPDFPLDAGQLPSLQDEPCRYPDARPLSEQRPYLYAAGRVRPLGEREGPAAALAVLGEGTEQRIPVLAVGSNASPRQLLDKFREQPVSDDSLPTLACRVRNVAIGYAAILSRNGYVPATLRHAPGAVCETWVQLLTGEQLRVIARTEGPAYRLVRVPDVEMVSTGAPTHAYGWAHEQRLTLGSGPVDLAEVEQADLLSRALHEVHTEVDWAAFWDGCRLPEGAVMPVREWLAGRAIENSLPSAWQVIDRQAADFVEALVGLRNL